MTTQRRDLTGHPLPAFRYGTTHVVAYTGTAARMSTGISDGCKLALVWCETDAHIAVGDNSVDATTSDKPITAKVDTPVVVNPGEFISAIQQSAGGNMYVTELR